MSFSTLNIMDVLSCSRVDSSIFHLIPDLFLSDLSLILPALQPSILQLFLLQKDMSDKRDAAMAGLPWPTPVRSTPNPRTTGSTDSEMTDDIGHESFPATAVAAPPLDHSYASPGSNARPTITTTSAHTMAHGHPVTTSSQFSS